MPHHEYDGSARDYPPQPYGLDGQGSAHDPDPRDEDREVILYRADGQPAVTREPPAVGFNLARDRR